MIRMVLLGLAFVAVTALLVVMPPGSRRADPEPRQADVVTRANPALTQAVGDALATAAGTARPAREPIAPSPRVSALAPADADERHCAG